MYHVKKKRSILNLIYLTGTPRVNVSESIPLLMRKDTKQVCINWKVYYKDYRPVCFQKTERP